MTHHLPSNHYRKDVSAIANSAGGLIVYGIAEFQHDPKKHLPEKIDPIDRTQFSKEWLEQIINDIRPRITNITIYSVQIGSNLNDVVYIVDIPQSIIPHQTTDHKYYRRFNFMSVPMEDYEITDVRNRFFQIEPLISFETRVKNNVIHILVRNIGTVPALDVSFEFSPNLTWKTSRVPRIFEKGIKMLLPKKEYSFFYATFPEIVHNENYAKQFDVKISYFHPKIARHLEENIYIDFMDYMYSTNVKSEVGVLNETLKKLIDNLTKEIRNVNQNLKGLPKITNATGLELSRTTLNNLNHLMKDEPFEKISPEYDSNFYQELLGVDIHMASRLESYFWHGHEQMNLEDIEGMTSDLLEKIKATIDLADYKKDNH